MRYKYLDVAKGITILFVLMAHSCGFPFGMGGYCTAYFMPLFFVLSGYLQKGVEFNREHIGRRSRKIIIPYFYYNTILFFVYLIWKGFDRIQDAVLAIVGVFYSTHCLLFPIGTENNIFFFRIENDPMWFLTAFFVSDVVFLFYVHYGRTFVQKIVIFVSFIVLTQTLYYCPVFLPWGIDKAFIGADFMIFGYELAKRNQKIQCVFKSKWKQAVCVLILAGAYGILVQCNPGVNLSTREYGCRGVFSVALYFVNGILGSVLCMWVSNVIRKIAVIGTMFAIMGRQSLPIMAVHLIIFRIYDQILSSQLPQEMIGLYYWQFSFVRIGITCFLIIGAAYGIQNLKR